MKCFIATDKVRFRAVTISTIFLLMVFLGQVSRAGEIIGQLTDPCSLVTPEYTDIVSARVEKSGRTLTFFITTRGPVPASVPDPCSLVYLWFVDADNCPQTGQSPGQVGSEFNIRAVVSSTLDGYVDVVGAWPPGGGQGDVIVNGNQIQMTIDMSQIDELDLFHFRCETFEWDGSTTKNSNGVTAQSAETWVSNYAVLYDVSNRYFGLDQDFSVMRCDPNDPYNPDTAVETEYNAWSNMGDSTPQFNSIQALLPAVDPYVHEYLIQALGSADFLHLRNLTYFDVANAAAGTFGQSRSQANSGVIFSLLSHSDQTGPIPAGLFYITIRHDYHLRSWTETDQAEAKTFAAVTITDMQTMENKLSWPDDRGIFFDQISTVKIDTIDLADLGLEFDRSYLIDLGLLDNARLWQPAVVQALAVTDSSLSVSINPVLTGDLDHDRAVNLIDLAMLAENWLKEK